MLPAAAGAIAAARTRRAKASPRSRPTVAAAAKYGAAPSNGNMNR